MTDCSYPKFRVDICDSGFYLKHYPHESVISSEYSIWTANKVLKTDQVVLDYTALSLTRPSIIDESFVLDFVANTIQPLYQDVASEPVDQIQYINLNKVLVEEPNVLEHFRYEYNKPLPVDFVESSDSHFSELNKYQIDNDVVVDDAFDIISQGKGLNELVSINELRSHYLTKYPFLDVVSNVHDRIYLRLRKGFVDGLTTLDSTFKKTSIKRIRDLYAPYITDLEAYFTDSYVELVGVNITEEIQLP